MVCNKSVCARIKYLTITAAACLLPGFLSAATLTSGHVDFIGIGYAEGAFEPHSHVEAGAVVDGIPLAADTEFELGELTVQVVGTTTRLAGTQWDPIGVATGTEFWRLTQSEVIGEPFIGIGAEELIASEWTTPISIKLTGMSAPPGGQFSLWQVDAFDVPTFYMSTLGGIGSEDVFLMDLQTADHAHFGWGFTAIGEYALTFEISGNHATDGPKDATATYNFSVIPEPSSALLGLVGMAVMMRRRR